MPNPSSTADLNGVSVDELAAYLKKHCPRIRVQLPEDTTKPHPKRFVSTRDVCARYGQKAARTIRRWVLAGKFPPPDLIIHRRNYWSEATLERHERDLVAGKSPTVS